MSYGRYLKKDGKYLAYQDTVDESNYWEVSELNMQIKSGWYLVDDVEKARGFANHDDASSFLAKQRGGFWRGFEVVRC